MAFCTNCGRELIPGQKCICQQQGNAQQQMQQNLQQQTAQQQMAQQKMEQERIARQRMAQQQKMEQERIARQRMAQQQKMEQERMAQQRMAQQRMGQQQMGQQTTAAQNRVPVDVGGLARSYFEIMLRPKSVGRSFVRSADTARAFIFIIVQAVFSGLFSVVVFNKINSTARSLFVASHDTDNLEKFENYKFPLFKDFFVTVIATIVLAFILALVLKGIIHIMKGRTSFGEALCAVAVRSTGKAPVILLAVIIGMIDLPVGIVLFGFSAIVGLCYSCMVVPTGVGVSEDKTAVIVLLTSIVAMICTYIFVRYCSINYLSSTVKSLIELGLADMKRELGNRSLSDFILSQFYSELF